MFENAISSDCSPISNSIFCAIFFGKWEQNLPFRKVRFFNLKFGKWDRAKNDSGARFRRWIFPINCSKFVVKCNWNIRNSQIVQSLVFFGKWDGFFEKKNNGTFKNRQMWQCFPDCVSKSSIAQVFSKHSKIGIFGQNRWVFPKIAWTFSEMLKVANFF